MDYNLRVETRGGVCDLGRVVGVLALLELTPSILTACSGGGGGLQIDVQLRGDSRLCRLCVSRLQALVAVTKATLTPVRRTANSGGQR